MSEYLDTATWHRRDAFEHFLTFDKPYFNVCANVDISNLLKLLNSIRKVSVTLAYHYFALRVANEIDAFRYRLRNGKVLVHPVIHGATTVMLPNEAFTFSYFDYQPDFWQFMLGAESSVAKVKAEGGFKKDDGDDRIHCTVIPWISFTSFSHARNWGREDSIPKLSFGKFLRESEKTLLPISVEVHHALMDGLHVGRYFQLLEEMFSKPEIWLRDI